MTITELIESLQYALAREGDIQVFAMYEAVLIPLCAVTCVSQHDKESAIILSYDGLEDCVTAVEYDVEQVNTPDGMILKEYKLPKSKVN